MNTKTTISCLLTLILLATPIFVLAQTPNYQQQLHSIRKTVLNISNQLDQVEENTCSINKTLQKENQKLRSRINSLQKENEILKERLSNTFYKNKKSSDIASKCRKTRKEHGHSLQQKILCP